MRDISFAFIQYSRGFITIITYSYSTRNATPCLSDPENPTRMLYRCGFDLLKNHYHHCRFGTQRLQRQEYTRIVLRRQDDCSAPCSCDAHSEVLLTFVVDVFTEIKLHDAVMICDDLPLGHPPGAAFEIHADGDCYCLTLPLLQTKMSSPGWKSRLVGTLQIARTFLNKSSLEGLF